MKLHLETFIDYGGFSRVYVARITSCSTGLHHLKPNDLVVVKKSHVTKHVRNPTLRHEACAMLLLKEQISTPKVYAWGRSQYYEYLAMERLGEDVASALNREGGLTVRSLAGIVCEMLDAIQHAHAHGIMHCDIKPGNFLFSLPVEGSPPGPLKLIDFGLARPWRDPTTQSHIPATTISGLVGTPVYTSVPVHRHHYPSRRDDMESLAYTIVKLLRGTLPWKDAKNKNDLLRAKLAWSGPTLCAGYPAVFADFFDYTRQLPFDSEPDYDFWRRSFGTLVADSGDDDAVGQIVGQPRGDAVEPRLEHLDTAEAEAPPSTSEDDGLPDSDDLWFPTSSWPPPHVIKDKELIADEECMVKSHLEPIEEPPSMDSPWLQPGLVEVMCL